MVAAAAARTVAKEEMAAVARGVVMVVRWELQTVDQEVAVVVQVASKAY